MPARDWTAVCRSGEVEQVVELYMLESTQVMGTNSKWFADIAGDEIAKVAEGLLGELEAMGQC